MYTNCDANDGTAEWAIDCLAEESKCRSMLFPGSTRRNASGSRSVRFVSILAAVSANCSADPAIRR